MERNLTIHGGMPERAALFAAIHRVNDLLAKKGGEDRNSCIRNENLAVVKIAEQGALTVIVSHESGAYIEARYIFGEKDDAQSALTTVLDTMFGPDHQEGAAEPKTATPTQPIARGYAKPASTPQSSPLPARDKGEKPLITDPTTPEVQEGKLKIQGATLNQLDVIEKFAPRKYGGAALSVLLKEIEAARALLLQPKAA